MNYLLTLARIWAAMACMVWGSVQALLNLGFDNRVWYGPLLIGALLCFVIAPDAASLEEFKRTTQRKRMLAEDAQRRANAALANRTT